MIPPTTSSLTTWPRINIPRDTVQVSTILTGGFGYNPIRFRITTGVVTNVLAPTAPPLALPGIAVFFTEYLSNVVAVNTSVNNTEGNFVITVLNATDFEVSGIDASLVNGEYIATMYVPKNRIAFPVRFTSVRDGAVTNYIKVAHT
jgi:hypothetical protein